MRSWIPWAFQIGEFHADEDWLKKCLDHESRERSRISRKDARSEAGAQQVVCLGGFLSAANIAFR